LFVAIKVKQYINKSTCSQELLEISAQVYAEKPRKAIHNFIGTFIRVSPK
jgi:hypothetical protein